MRRRREEKKALLQAGSSAYSMVPVSDEAAASNGEVKFDRLSMMFAANDPKPQDAAGAGAGVQVNATPLLTPQQAAQQGYPQAYPQYPQGYPHQI